MKPTAKPNNPRFSSGPCAKRPGWSLDALQDAALGRSHRAKLGKGKLEDVIARSKKILGMPDNYLLGIVPASDTGAVEMALWSLLGPRGVDVFAWESFSSGWASDCKNQLKLKDLNVYKADYGKLPDLSDANWGNDVVFTWNGTTSGVRVPDGNWIPKDRKGLSICDATSAVFAMEMPWDKLDVVTWSWQKVLGGEAAHGMIALSPRAVERLQSYTPAWPLPKIFQMTKGGKLIEGIFKGETINTPSMLAVEDALDALKWAEAVGGLPGLIKRSESNLAAVAVWVAESDWVEFLAEESETRSCTSICLKIVDPWFTGLSPDAQAEAAKKIASMLEKEGVAYDIGAYRDAPPGLRIWGGATVETSDLTALFPWLNWAWGEGGRCESSVTRHPGEGLDPCRNNWKEYMLSIGWNEVIVAVIATLILSLIYWGHRKYWEWKDSKKIYEWMKSNSSDTPGNKFRSTKAISAGVRLSEERIKSLLPNKNIRPSVGDKPNMWTIHEGPERSVYEERGIIQIEI